LFRCGSASEIFPSFKVRYERSLKKTNFKKFVAYPVNG
jgi:hypothetical protein